MGSAASKSSSSSKKDLQQALGRKVCLALCVFWAHRTIPPSLLFGVWSESIPEHTRVPSLYSLFAQSSSPHSTTGNNNKSLQAASVPAPSPQPPAAVPSGSAFSDSVVPLGHTAYANEGYHGAPLPADEEERMRTLASLKVLVSV